MSQTKNDDDKSESDASVSLSEASQIIRETLANTHQTNTDCTNHTNSNIVSKGGVNGVESYDYVHNPIPSAVFISPVEKGSSSNKRNRHKPDDDDGAYGVRRRRQRRKKWVSKEVPVPSFSQNVKKPCSSYNCNKILNQKEKMERKRISVATDPMKEMPQVSSIMVEKKTTTSKTFHFAHTSYPKQHRGKEVCLHCKNKEELCHEEKYSKYCLQAAHSYLHSNNEDWLAGFSPARMESVFGMAYNEIRRSDIFLKFGYYTPELFIVPKCMELGSMREAVELGFNPIVDKTLSQENREGESMYHEAKKDYEC